METELKFARHLRAEIQIPVSDLRVGMFVSRPDCGWHKTPYMLEGLLIKDVKEVSVIAKFAKHVVVDPRRSQLSAFNDAYLLRIYEDEATPGRILSTHLPSGPTAAAAAERAPFWKNGSFDWRTRLSGWKSDAKDASKPSFAKSIGSDPGIGRLIATEPDTPFREYISIVYAPQEVHAKIDFRETLLDTAKRIIGFLRGGSGQTVKDVRPLPLKSRPAFIPSDIALVIYPDPDPEPTYVSLPKARAACDHLENTLKCIVDDISTLGLSNVETLREAADTVVDNMITRPDTMMWIAKMRAYSDARYQQALNVAIHLTALGRQIGLQREQLADLAGIGLLLDMGKVKIDASLLNKPGRLTSSEIEIIRTHVKQGLKMFGESGNLPEIMTRAIAEHHERMDGTGYPNGLAGNDISIYGRMAAIADGFVAMVNPRPYAPTYTAYDAIRQLFRESESRWFRPLVEQFVQSIGIFPVGSLVELSTGEVAIIVQHNRIRRMEPKVLVVTDKAKLILDHPWDLDLLRHHQSAINKEIRIAKGVPDGGYGIDFRNYYLSAK